MRHKAEKLVEEDPRCSDDILAQRDYMDTVCRSFASRLERRKILLITSVRFHRFAEDVSLFSTSNLLDKLFVTNDLFLSSELLAVKMNI